MPISTIGSAGINQAADTTLCTTSGNVGIGTASPTYKLDVAQTSGDVVARVFANATTTSSRLEITNGDGTTAINYSYIRFINNKTSSQDWRFGTYGSNNLSFVNLTAGTTPMTLDSSGNLLVGKTSTSYAVQGIALRGDNAGVMSTTDGAEALTLNRLTSNGTLALFARSTTTVGTISVTTTATAYNTSSDYRLKENIAPMTGALAKVFALKPVTYKWKADGSDGEGFIAHELQEVVPQCVNGEKDAVDADGNPVYQGIDTSFLVATLTAAIQELKTELDSVKAELAALKGTA